nr:hypothetical protein BCU26_09625 [Vibrio splendidus]
MNNIFDKKLQHFLFGNIGVFSIRFLYFFVLSFVLSISELGLFTTILSISALFLSLVSYGNYNLTMRRRANGEDSFLVLSEYMTSSFALLLILVAMIYVTFPLFSNLFVDLNLSVYTIIKIILSEYAFVAVSGLFKSAVLSEYDEKIKLDALTNIISSTLLLIFVLVLFVFKGNEVSLSYWSNIYFLVACITILVRFFIWKKHLYFTSYIKVFSIIKVQLIDGASFMFASLMRGSFLHLDKLLIVLFFGLEMAGYYAVSFRFFNVMLMTLNSVSAVKEAKLYQVAREGINAIKREISEINKKSIIFFLYSTPVWIFIFVAVHFLYEQKSLEIIVLLYLLCPLQLIAFTMLNSLNSLNYEKIRILILLFSFVINCITVYIAREYIGWGSIILGMGASSIFVVLSSKLLINSGGKDEVYNR